VAAALAAAPRSFVGMVIRVVGTHVVLCISRLHRVCQVRAITVGSPTKASALARKIMVQIGTTRRVCLRRLSPMLSVVTSLVSRLLIYTLLRRANVLLCVVLLVIKWTMVT